MMLSTVSSNGLGEGADGFCANRNCGASKDRTQRARPAYRRCLGFMVTGFSECVTKAFYRRGRKGFRRGRRELPSAHLCEYLSVLCGKEALSPGCGSAN